MRFRTYEPRVINLRPEARILEVVDVALSRPRRRDTLEFGRLYESINAVLSDEVRRTLELTLRRVGDLLGLTVESVSQANTLGVHQVDPPLRSGRGNATPRRSLQQNEI